VKRVIAALALLALPACAQDDAILRAMGDEIERSRALRLVAVEQPYFIEYGLDDGENVSGSASLGALIGSHRVRYRLPRIQVRVGDYSFDNTNFAGTAFYSGTRYEVDQFPLDNSYAALRQHLWLATDMAYKAALEGFSHKRAALSSVTLSEQTPDFAKAAPLKHIEPVRAFPLDEAAWLARVRRLSAVFLDYPRVTWSQVEFEGGQSAQYLANSEGTRVCVPEGMINVRARATAQAPDGMPLRDAATFLALDPLRMPSDAALERGARQVAMNLTALVEAPSGEPYNGPVLFEGAAGAQLLAEVLGKSLAIPRRPVSLPGRPIPFSPSELEGRIGSRILPEWIDVVDDPTQKQWRGQPLFGAYNVDLEGVAAAPLVLVRKGVLKDALLSRQGVKGFPGSNGRARLPGSFGAKAASFSNLFVRTAEGAPAAQLKQKLIDLCRERGKPYGIMVRKMDFPSSATVEEAGRLFAAGAQAGVRPVSVPLLAYRVYPDGREELVRGLRFRGVSVRSLRDILAASEETYVFDFLDNTAPFALIGAVSYVTQASVIAPAILVDDLEMERVQDELPKPPAVPPPPLL